MDDKVIDNVSPGINLPPVVYTVPALFFTVIVLLPSAKVLQFVEHISGDIFVPTAIE